VSTPATPIPEAPGGSPYFEKGVCPSCGETCPVHKSDKKPVSHICSTGPKPRLERAPSDSRPLRVYIVGAHSVGKTSLARWISKAYGLPLVTEVARAVLAEKELPLEVLRTDIERTAEFQSEVFRRQATVEDAAGSRFVSDRAFDNLAYAASHTVALSKIAASVPEYVKRLKAPGSIVLFVRPHRELMAEDGMREHKNWEEIVRIDGMVRLLLELNDVNYVVIASLSMAERARTVMAVLDLCGAKREVPA
jgi:nicotinamide riboside kinase